jgi:lipopolysaccharide/colanic/teichoic acid biosynthesis glycosyltransferase
MQNFFNCLIGSILLAATAPTMALVALVIGLTSGKPIFHRRARIDEYGRTYVAWAFRTKGPSAPDEVRSSAQFTAVGRLLWVTRLDELPIVLNLASGTAKIGLRRIASPGFYFPVALTILAPR